MVYPYIEAEEVEVEVKVDVKTKIQAFFNFIQEGYPRITEESERKTVGEEIAKEILALLPEYVRSFTHMADCNYIRAERKEGMQDWTDLNIKKYFFPEA